MTSRLAIAIDGTEQLFNVTFPYIEKYHVVVALNRVVQYDGINYEWVGDQQIRFFTTPPRGILEINRNTPYDKAMVLFHNGATLTEDELNLAVLQNLYALEETRDLYDALINGSLDSLVLEGGNDTAGPVIDKVIQQILDSEQLKELEARIGDINTNAQAILDTQIHLSNLDEVLGAFANLDGVTIGTFLENLQTQQVQGDTALAEQLALIGAKSGDGKGWVLNKNTVQVDPGTSLADTLNALQASIGNVEASVASEASARADSEGALSTRIDNVEASITSPTGGVQAMITTESNARVSADNAIGTRIDGVIATVGANKALFDTEVTARASGDQANATAITNLGTTVGQHTAQIQTLQTTANGLSASYVVKTDVNGYVAGFGLWNGGTSSQFYVLADKFAVVSPGYGAVVPFAVDANGVYMNNAYIRNLTVDKITGGAIQSQWNLNSTNGRIVLDTGAFMKVIGVGFGQYGDLIEWFGPKMAISSCTKANATTYVGMDGSAYFGGSLSAGVLYNARTSTDISANASLTVGPFWTNGKPKTVVVSYTQSFQWNAPGKGVNQSGTCSAQVQLFQTVNGGAESLLATLTATGTYSSVWDSEFGTQDYQQNCSGSLTITDNYNGANNITYRAQVVNRTYSYPGGGSPSQRITITSTES